MIVCDTETTGLLQPEVTPIEQQPKIIEFAGIKLDDATLEVVGSFSFLCNPGELLQPIITKITGITDADLKGKPPFQAFYLDLVDFFLGERIFVAHNASFDIGMMTVELKRLGTINKFPWPFRHVCTIELTQHWFPKYPKLTELYKKLFGKVPDQRHRALGDVEILVECVRALRKEGLL